MKPKVKLHIDIPEPCNKNWDTMSPDINGRFCHHCEKIVVDFRTMNDQQLMDFLATIGNKPICGRFLQSQLNRTLVSERPATRILNIRLLKRIAAGMLLLQAMVNDSWGQVKKTPNVTVAPQPKKKTQFAILHGRLADQATGQPIPDVTITLLNTSLTDTTNAQGEFSIQLDESAPESFKFKAHYLDSNKRPEQTRIFSEPFTMRDVWANRRVNIFRYASDQLDSVSVSLYKTPLIDPFANRSITEEQLQRMGLFSVEPVAHTVGGVYTRSRTTTGESCKPSLWQRIKNMFKR